MADQEVSRQDNYVGLNVGGKIYQTSRTTLLRFPDSFFSTLLDSSVPSAKDDKGNYLIDLDGKIFRHILNFLRHGKLVLPEDFSEYGLLECQADFFRLETLSQYIQKLMKMDGTASVGLMFPDGKVFHTTSDILLKEENSFFTKMLSGEVTVPRDLQGIYILNRGNSGVFHHILSYLKQGGIFEPLVGNELDLLREEAGCFGLELFAAHLYSVRCLSPKTDIHLHIHFYYCVNFPCVAYTSLYPPSHDNSILETMVTDRLMHQRFQILRRIASGVVNMENINRTEPASLLDVISYLETEGDCRIPSRDIKHLSYPGCIRIEVQIDLLN